MHEGNVNASCTIEQVMSQTQKEKKMHLDKTTNTVVLDYVLYLSAKTILDEALSQPKRPSPPLFGIDGEQKLRNGASSEATALPTTHPNAAKTKGRRLVGLVDGLIMTFDLTNRPKLGYSVLTRRLQLTSLVILFVYRDVRSQHITRRSAHHRGNSGEDTLDWTTKKTRSFLDEMGLTHVVILTSAQLKLSATTRPAKVVSMARSLFGIESGPVDPMRTSLASALHLFIQVSAASFLNAPRKRPAEKWIRLALTFAQFTALEHCLTSPQVDVQACLDDCFSYGSMENPNYGSAELDALFHVRELEFSQDWSAERDKVLSLFTRRSSDTTMFVQQLLDAAKSMEFDLFRIEVMEYLDAILHNMADPDLCRYPNGVLDRSILRAPGMISIAHEVDPQTNNERENSMNENKRRKVQA